MSDFERNIFRKKILDYEAQSQAAWKSTHLPDENENDNTRIVTGTAPTGLHDVTTAAVDNEERDTVGGLNTTQFKGARITSGKLLNRRKSEIEPKSWSQYFSENFQLSDNDGTRTFNIYYTPPKDADSPIFIFHHGTSSSGLSFAVMSSRIVSLMKKTASQSPSSAKSDKLVAGIVSFDMRGHGRTIVNRKDKNNYSLETLTDDFLTMCQLVEKKKKWGSSSSPAPPLILVGHSLGGAVVANTVLKGVLKNVVGVVVLDAVEGPALEALSNMDKVLSTWPKQFDSISRGIEWHLKSNSLRNKESAEVSVPGVLKLVNASAGSDGPYTWILDPKSTDAFWTNWFTGLSNNFLNAPAARLLILAGTDRLDKALMIGQMQGKYQLVVFAESGHFIQEDEPEKTAITVCTKCV